ncbi:hypothetical protein GGI42DRAFT_236122 [Trichoderma sp. SZMC 28013]
MVPFNTYECLTKRRGVREKRLVVNETVWPCDWILCACSAPERGFCSDVSDLCLCSALLCSSHTLLLSIAVPSASSLVSSRAIPSSHHHHHRAPSLSRVRKGLRASVVLSANERVSQLVGRATDPITRCLPMRLFWTGIQRLSRYPPSRPFFLP